MKGRPTQTVGCSDHPDSLPRVIEEIDHLHGGYWDVKYSCSVCGEQLRSIDVWHGWQKNEPLAIITETTITKKRLA